MAISVRTPSQGDFFPWLGLYESYATAHGVQLDDHRALVVWTWLTDDSVGLSGLVAVDDGRVVGLVHFQEQSRPLEGDRVYVIDDLEVEAGRGDDVVRALVDAVSETAARRGGTAVRWVLDPSDARDRDPLEGIGERTDLVVYTAPVRVPARA